MKTEHPITPPPELVQQWLGEYFGCTVSGELSDAECYLATQAARWGADQELEACCKWLPKLPPWSADDLRKHRRPKPPSLKKQALAVIENSEICDHLSPEHAAILRRALKALPE